MTLNLLFHKTIRDVQEDFNKAYSFLKIEFFKNIEAGFSRRQLSNSITIMAAGLTSRGDITLTDEMTVGQLENTFKEKFGLNIQVSRRCGSLWLETTMTDKWTLKQQNDHGRELTEPLTAMKVIPEKETGRKTG
jgi:hypothetical protein